MAKLYFYYSAMNAGKSTVLLQSAYNYRERGMDALILTPAFDTRSGEGKVRSRIGVEADAIMFKANFDFFAYVQNEQNKNQKLACVLIDEAQFLTKQQVMQLTAIVDKLKLPVLAYGLRSDFMGEPFEGSKYLLVWADNLIELKTICHCGRKAILTARIDDAGHMINAGEQVQIGGNERYISLCRKHYNEMCEVK